jgi:Endonuclease/Exonuclease/phosphatase family
VRIATWNVERPAARSPKNRRRIDLLRSLDADVLILTETHVAINLGPEYACAATTPSPRKPRPGESVATIWWRNSHCEFVREIETADSRESVCIELGSPLGATVVYGSIIPYHGYRGPAWQSPVWHEHRKAIEWQGRDWVGLRQARPEHVFIAAGDYNQTRDGVGRYGTASVRQALSAALRAAGLACVTEEDFVATGKLSQRHSVDHICLDTATAARVRTVGAWEAEQSGKRLSDHNGVWVDLGTGHASDRQRKSI